jgi:hypothetical protein
MPLGDGEGNSEWWWIFLTTTSHILRMPTSHTQISWKGVPATIHIGFWTKRLFNFSNEHSICHMVRKSQANEHSGCLLAKRIILLAPRKLRDLLERRLQPAGRTLSDWAETATQWLGTVRNFDWNMYILVIYGSHEFLALALIAFLDSCDTAQRPTTKTRTSIWRR